MRTDMASMNPGKGMAQAAHAGNALNEQMRQLSGSVFSEEKYGFKFAPNGIPDSLRLYKKWTKETKQGFGTTIVLGADIQQIVETTDRFLEHPNFYPAGYVFDPGYPVRDGDVTHLIPLISCSYILCSKDNIWAQNELSSYSLHH
jgi:hypothetical protein